MKALWALQEAGVVEIVGLGDVFEGNLTEEKLGRYVSGIKLDGIGTFTDFDRLFDETRPDAMYFAIPPGFHNGEVVRTAQAGVHIFAEKPMSLFLDEAIEMNRAIREAGVISTAGFQRRYEVQSGVAHTFLAEKRMVAVTMVSESLLEGHSVKHSQTSDKGGPADKVWAKNFA